MGNIVLLDDLTINKIAAGEVIERPASVVKEVVENSIDAGADNISVEIKNGGISYIRITDNGKGIAVDDLEIAFERHATSKIRKADDLETVKSMGFRGEALASISAIARVELVTKTEDSNIGHRIIVEGGKVLLKEEIGCPKGTTITVENLFYNTPVRYKFLKKDFTESGYIEDAITRLAVANPNIAIKLINTGKTVMQTSGNGNVKDIIYGIYGKDISENILEVDYSFEDMRVKGVIGRPKIARSNRSNQLFFVNKRFVKDKTLTSAVEQAFKGRLPIGKYAFLILNLEIDPHKLDVNVHPAKLEVRFQEESKIFNLVCHAVEEALNKDSKKEIEDNDNDYVDEIEKIENKLFNGTSASSEKVRSESKGIGGFFKSILGGQKNEFVTPDENVVEQVYRDKFQSGTEQESDRTMNNQSYTINSKFDKVSSQPNKEEDSKLIASEIPKVITDPEVDNKVDEDINEEKNTEKIETSKPEEDNHFNENSDTEKEEKEEKEEKKEKKEKTSNLERLVRELDANLKKLNLKPSNIGIGKKKKTSIDEEKLTENEKDKTIDDEKATKETNLNKEAFIEKDEDLSKRKDADTDTSSNVNDIYLSRQQETTINSSSNSEVLENNVNSNINNRVSENNINDDTDYSKTTADIYTNKSLNDLGMYNSLSKKNINETVDNKESDLNFEEMYEKMFGTHISGKGKVEEEVDEKGYKAKQEDFRTVESVSLFTNNAFYNKPIYKYIGIVFGEDIVIEYENEMYIVKQRSANTRILYEKLRSNYYNDTDKDSQLMLLPDVINLTEKQMGIVEDAFDALKRTGFDIELFGDKTIKLSSVPSMCMELDTKQLFISILEKVNTVARTSKEEILDKLMETVASEAATKIRLAMNQKEVDDLIQQLLLLPKPFVSPDGTPTAIRMSKADIEKKFSRR